MNKTLDIESFKADHFEKGTGYRYFVPEPFIHVKEAEKICHLSTKVANDMVNLFVQQGVLKEISGKTRYRFFLFGLYLDLFKESEG